MPEHRDSDATILLQRMSSGDSAAANELLARLYDELHGVAGRLMAGERAEHTMQPTALIHEAFLRLVDQSTAEWQGRVHFMRVAARAMRNVLIDHARARRAEKRGGGKWHKVTLVEDIAEGGHDPDSLLAVDETLSRLSEMDPQLGQIVELRFFGGLKDREIAAALDISERSVQRGWRTARAWLLREMSKANGDGSS